MANEKMENGPAKTEMVAVRLTGSSYEGHRHEGEGEARVTKSFAHKPGDTVQLPKHEADRIVALGVAELAK